MNSSEIKLKADLRASHLKNVFLFYGEDTYKAEYYAEKIYLKFANKAERVLLYGSDLNIESLEGHLATMSLFGGTKAVFLKEADKLSKPIWQRLHELLASLSEEVFVFIFAKKLDKRKKEQKEIAAKLSTSVEFKFSPAKEVEKWIAEIAKQKKLKVSVLAQSRLAFLYGSDLFAIDHAIDRAHLFIGKGTEVTAEAVEAVSIRIRADSIFDFVDAICRKKQKRAFELLQSMWRQGEDPIPLTALLAKQYRWLLQIKTAEQAGKPRSAIRQDLRIYPSLVDRLLDMAASTPLQSIQNTLRVLEDTDYALKYKNVPSKYTFESAIAYMLK